MTQAEKPALPHLPKGENQTTALKVTHIVVLPKHISRDRKAIFFYSFTQFK
jgi:hypothetical protein